MIGFSSLIGQVELSCESRYGEALVSTVANEGIDARFSLDAENGNFKVKMKPSDAKKIAATLDKNNIIVYINSVCGIKYYLNILRKRLGLVCGMLLFFALVTISSLFVFRVEVVGSDLISSERIKNELSELGVCVGTPIKDIDCLAVSNEFLSLHPEFSFASLSINGTCVRIELKEKNSDAAPQTSKASYLVARCDGVIKSILVQSGKGAVNVGTVVKKGDLLINGYISGSGLQYTENPILRFDGAEGSVRAEVVGKVDADVYFDEEQVKKERGKRTALTISIFGNEISFGDVDSENTDKSAEKNLTLFGSITLPITYTEYFEVNEISSTVTFAEEQAINEARKRAYQRLGQELFDAEISRITEKVEIGDDRVTVTLDYLCEMEIAVAVE